MTSKEKAIEALKNTNIIDILIYKDLMIAELSKPTLDDAIKVVEEIAKTNKDQYSVHMVKLQAYDEVLTALKGLKEGKE